MLSWGVAFRKAGAMVLYMIGWGILGGIFIGIGFAASDDVEALVFFLIIGYLIIYFGITATGIKIGADAAAEAVEDRLRGSLQQLTSQRASTVGTSLGPRDIGQSVCSHCGAQIRAGARFCANCGNATANA